MESKPSVAEGYKPAFQEQHHSLVGPIILIALGAVFLVGQFVPAWRFGKTWPVLLIAIGVGKLAETFFTRRSGPSNKAAAPSSPGEKSL